MGERVDKIVAEPAKAEGCKHACPAIALIDQRRDALPDVLPAMAMDAFPLRRSPEICDHDAIRLDAAEYECSIR